MINGVKIKKIERFFDDRGFFGEILKKGDEVFSAFAQGYSGSSEASSEGGKEIKQTSYTETYPGVIKAFHWHEKQHDIWFPVKGNIQIVLNDLRADSPTKGETQVIYAGESNPLVVLIPPKVAHGYQVLGEKTAGLFYHTSEVFDAKNPDEKRISFDDPKINFDWQTKNR